ncbi:MAG: magnesium transporter [Planctomycetes bacterium]|nr:magnesium transporter [Planctomycetota bacterium]MBL7106888.1 magnesium transporter [Phycisphaerae bacterium]
MPEERKLLLQQIRPLLEEEKKEELEAILKEERSSAIAEIVELLDSKDKRLIFDCLDKQTGAEVLEKVDEATRDELFELFNESELTELISELNPDDAADILIEIEEDRRKNILSKLDPAESSEIIKLMSYSEDSAGGIMDSVLISVPEDASVAEATSKIRAAEIDEDFYSVYVVSRKGVFLGDVRIRLLLTSLEDIKMSQLVDPDTIYVEANDDQEAVRNIFSKNDLIVVPVLDRHHRLIGRITADRVIEVAEEEAAEDLYVMAGTDAEELESFSPLRAARIRMTWLLPCMVGTSITTMVMIFFKTHDPLIYIAASAFVPMIAAISGNAGLQTSTIVVSGLATGHLAAMRLKQVFSREVKIAFLVALSCGVIGGIACSVIWGIRGAESKIEPLRIITAFAVAMFTSIMVATTLGLFLPFLFRQLKIDPAISSGPLVTTANDSISVAIYLFLAVLLSG